jgi:hypothetical protein
MLDSLKTLFENNVISEEMRAEIEQAWESRVVENRKEVNQQLREEFAQRYEHDKQVMVEALDKMIADHLEVEIREFKEDKAQLAEAKAKYAKKMKDDSSKMKEFVVHQLAKEISELHEDQKQTADKFGKLEQFVIDALSEEIAEFYADKQDLAETKVKLVREGKEQISKLKEKFVKRAASMVETMVSESLSKEITQLKEDIESARRNDFGRKLFEAYASEYQASYLNEKSETSKLLNVIDLKDVAITEAKTAVVEKQKVLESKESEIKRLQDAVQRQGIVTELLAPLSKDQKAIMSELLESVQTPKLQNSFEKYLPAVIAGETKPKQKQALVEAKEVTGNKETHSVGSSEHESNIFNMRRLAGIKH